MDFVARYVSKPVICAAAMGQDGSVLCHALYAWAVSYGVDECGNVDVPEAAGSDTLSGVKIEQTDMEPSQDRDRQQRMVKTARVVHTILREIDDFGLLRKPSLDGVLALLLTLPLTEGKRFDVRTC